MNIDYKNILENMDNSEDGYRGCIQKIMILQVIQGNICEILIGGRKIVCTDFFSKPLISGQIFKVIIQSLKGYFTKICQRNPLQTKIYVILMGMVKGDYALCLHT